MTILSELSGSIVNLAVEADIRGADRDVPQLLDLRKVYLCLREVSMV